MSNLSIVVPVYFNDLSLYKVIDKCISNIKKYYPNEELIIIDDCSPYETKEWIDRADQSIECIDNLGYTVAVISGMKAASCDKIVVINDDVFIREGDLDRFYNMDYGIYSPKTSDEGQGDRFGSIWGTTKKTLDTLGYLNPKLRHFFSDAEYYDRAKKMRVPIYKWNDIIVEHLGGKTYETINKEELYNADHDIYRKITS